jgi:hypothetical protein
MLKRLWNESSTPPKPKGFDIDNIMTWEDLLYDDIPKIANPESQYYDIFSELADSRGVSEAIYLMMVKLGSLTGFDTTGKSEWSIAKD